MELLKLRRFFYGSVYYLNPVFNRTGLKLVHAVIKMRLSRALAKGLLMHLRD